MKKSEPIFLQLLSSSYVKQTYKTRSIRASTYNWKSSLAITFQCLAAGLAGAAAGALAGAAAGLAAAGEAGLAVAAAALAGATAGLAGAGEAGLAAAGIEEMKMKRIKTCSKEIVFKFIK